jgi:hypothetical protein
VGGLVRHVVVTGQYVAASGAVRGQDRTDKMNSANRSD